MRRSVGALSASVGFAAALAVVAGTMAQEPLRSLKIAVIAKSEANFVFLAARRGAEDAAVALSRRHGAHIEISWLTPPREDAAQQVERVGQAVRQGAQAILLAASEPAALASAVNAATDHGVAVMTFDSDVPGSNRFAFYGADDADLGDKLMVDLAEQVGGKGKVAILAGNPNAQNLRARGEAVRKAAARFPGMDVVGVVNHTETPQDAVAELMRFDSTHPDLAGWAMVGGWPLFRSSQTPALVAEIERRKLKIVAVDALPEQLFYVERGLVPVLWAQPVYRWGEVGVATIVDKVLLKKSVPQRIPMDLVRVTRQNLGTWARRLKSWGFSVPQEYLAPE